MKKTKARILLVAILFVATGIFLVDYFATRALLPAPLYAVPMLMAALLLPPSMVAAVTIFTISLYVFHSSLHQLPQQTALLYQISLVFIGFLGIALSMRTRREAVLKAQAERTAEEMRQVSNTLHTLLATMPAGVLVSDAAGRIVTTNRAAQSLLGDAAKDKQGLETHASLLRTDGSPYPPAELPLARALEKGETVRDVEMRVRLDDGTERTLIASAAPLRNVLGNTTGAVAVFQDISAHWMAEAMLQIELAARRDLESIINRSPAVAFLWQATKGWPVEFVSDNVEQFGYTPEEFAYEGISYDALVHPEDFQRVVTEVSTSIKEGRMEFPLEYRILTKSGEVRWVEARTWAVRADGGRVSHYQGIVLDITERKRVEEEHRRLLEKVQRQAAEMDTIIASIPDMVLIYNPSGQMVRMNLAAARILGYTEAQQRLTLAERAVLTGLETPEGRPFPPEEIPGWRALKGETVSGVVLAMHPQTGGTVWVTASAAPIMGPDGQLLGAVSVFTDITSLHELQEQREDLLGVVSHDLRSPLAIIQGNAQLLQQSLDKAGLNGPAHQRANAIVASTQRMNTMIQDLIDSVRLRAGQMPLQCLPTPMATFTLGLKDRLGMVLDTDRIGIEAPEGDPIALVDHDRLERILTNLLSNALKYTKGQVKVRVEAIDHEVRVSVIDHGPGIHPEDRSHLFRRFYRATGTGKTDGMGLGLYITRMQVEALGGRIWVESEPGAGSAFCFTLPAVLN